MIKSIINAGKISNQLKKKTIIRIDAEQMVMSVLEIMLTRKEFVLPVFEAGKCIGVVHFKDLVLFLAHDLEKTDLFVHKLNYTVESAILTLMEISKKESA